MMLIIKQLRKILPFSGGQAVGLSVFALSTVVATLLLDAIKVLQSNNFKSHG